MTVKEPCYTWRVSGLAYCMGSGGWWNVADARFETNQARTIPLLGQRGPLQDVPERSIQVMRYPMYFLWGPHAAVSETYRSPICPSIPACLMRNKTGRNVPAIYITVRAEYIDN